MSSNVIKTDESVETNQGDTFDAALQAKMGTKFLKMFSAEAGADVKSGSSDSQKVLESFKVAMTKSLILSEVMEKCKDIKRDFKQVEEGRLVRIDNVSLSLENEKELRTVCFLGTLADSRSWRCFPNAVQTEDAILFFGGFYPSYSIREHVPRNFRRIFQIFSKKVKSIRSCASL